MLHYVADPTDNSETVRQRLNGRYDVLCGTGMCDRCNVLRVTCFVTCYVGRGCAAAVTCYMLRVSQQ